MVALFNWLKKNPKKKIDVLQSPAASIASEGQSLEYNDGSKFHGGFGPTKIYIDDFWTLRERSNQLFKENLYARGLIRRLITNEINTGLTPEVDPNERILGYEEDFLGDWAENIEDRFSIWGDSSNLCDTTQLNNFWEIQRIVRAESIINGDVLVVLRLDRITGLPRIQIINSVNIMSPLASSGQPQLNGVKIVQGVELNQFNQQIAYHVRDQNGKTNRIPAYGQRTGRRIAWLVYGSDRRISGVRGEPLLSIIFQSLKEVDRYRDATQRKAVINSILAMFIKKTQDKIATKPITGGAVKKKSVELTESGGDTRKYNIAKHIPGFVIENLQVGEEPMAFGNQGIDTDFGKFESAVIQAIAWANEVPPEILQLAFSSNYSASQAAINEFKNYLNKIRSQFGAVFCKPIYHEWLLSEVLSGKIEADGFLQAWRNPAQYDIYGAWVQSDWSGAIKPSTDIRKQAQGYGLMVKAGWITNTRAAKELTGTKFRRNIRTIKRENQAKIEAGLDAEVEASIPRDETDVDETLENSED